jgi:two-component system NtrC family sensor kinase
MPCTPGCPSLSRSTPRFRVLVVEDDPTSAVLVRRVVESRGHEVQVCETAEDALVAHAERHFQIMVVDWLLPGIDGVEFCRRLRQSPANQDVVILMVTGQDSPEALATVLEAGATDFMPKSLTAAHLATRVAVAEASAREKARRRVAETALSVAKAEFQTIFESIPDAVVFTDRERRILRMNPAFSSLFGYSEFEVLGRKADQVLGVVPRGRTQARFDLSLEEGSELRGRTEWVCQPKGGGELTIDALWTEVRNPRGQVSGLLGIFRDVTERVALQARLQVADRMASMGTLAAGVAHEINTPLTFIMGNLNFLSGELAELAGPRPSPRMEELSLTIQEALEGSSRVRDIVKELRTFARGSDEEEIGPVDVARVMESTLSMAKNHIKHKARVSKDYGKVDAVHADPGKLGQVFLNLVVNAAQALPDGQVDDHWIRLGIQQEDGLVLVSVGDTGPGISPDAQTRIFDPFYTTKPVGEGTGLGLAICHSIVAQMGGDILLESELGKGTCFTVRLPVVSLGEPATEP